MQLIDGIMHVHAPIGMDAIIFTLYLCILHDTCTYTSTQNQQDTFYLYL